MLELDACFYRDSAVAQECGLRSSACVLGPGPLENGGGDGTCLTGCCEESVS